MPVNPLDVYRIVSDHTMDQGQKSAAIDALYDTPAPAPLPDARTAEVDPGSIMAGSGGMDAGPNMSVAPTATDAGGAPPPPPSPGALSSQAASVPAPVAPPAPNASPVPPGFGAAPASPPVAPAGPAVPGEDAETAEYNNALGRYLQRQAMGSPGQYVAAHDQPVSTTVQHEAALPDEMKDKIEGSRQAEEGLTLASGDTQAANAEKEAEQLEGTTFNQNLAEDQFRQEQVRQQKELRGKLDDYGKLVKDTENHPGDWWGTKTTGQKAMTLASAFLFGLARDTSGIDKLIQDDVKSRADNRQIKLGAARSRIEDLKSRMQNPDSAKQVELAMGYRTAATEMERLAASAKSPEIKDRAALAVQNFQTRAAELEAEAWRREHGTMQTQIAHVPGKAVGGRAPDVLGVVKRAKEAGLNPEKAARGVVMGSYETPGGGELSADQRNQKESEIGRTVTFSDGTKLYARNPGEAVARQKAVDSSNEILNAYNYLEKALNTPGRTISRTDLAKINATIAQNMVELKNSNELGAITQADEKIIVPLSGSGTGDTVSLDAATKAGIQQARQLLLHKQNTGKGSLFKEPWSNAKTGGASAASVEVQP